VCEVLPTQKTKNIGGECIWLHIVKKSEEYHIRGSCNKEITKYKNPLLFISKGERN
jgi:hypothetical protein